jgi:hypothetical protein
LSQTNLNVVEPTYEEAVRYAWKLGRLDYRRRNTQKHIKNRIIETQKISRKAYIESTRRLGKSSELLATFTEHCLQKPNWKAGFFAPVKDGLLDYIAPIIQKTFADCPEEERPKFNAQRFTLEFNNGSTIIFRGSNNKQHRVRRGQEFNEAGIDEARDVDDLDVLIDSVIMPALFSADGYLYITSTPADTRSHPLYRYRQQAEAEGWLIKLTIWEANQLDPKVYPINLINEWKSETLKSVDGEDVWEREYECKWVVNKSRAAVPEWSSAYVKDYPRDPYYGFYHHYVAIDWGYRDFTAIGFATYNYREARLEVESELAFSGTDVRSDKIALAIHGQAVKLWGPSYETNKMVSDSSDPILINELNQHPHMNFVPVHKTNSLEAMLNQFRVLVNQGKIIVSPKCPMTTHCLANAVWDSKREKLDQDVFARHFDHLMQLVYMTRMLDMATNPIPNDFMIDGINIINLDFNKHNGKSDDAMALEQAFGGRRR